MEKQRERIGKFEGSETRIRAKDPEERWYTYLLLRFTPLLPTDGELYSQCFRNWLQKRQNRSDVRYSHSCDLVKSFIQAAFIFFITITIVIRPCQSSKSKASSKFRELCF